MLDKLKDLIEKNWKQYAVWAAVSLCLYALYLLKYTDRFAPPAPPIPIFNPEAFRSAPNTYHFGYIPDEEAVEAFKTTLQFKTFADTPAGRQEKQLPDHVYLWQLYPDGAPIKNQGPVGSCVSFGTNGAIEDTMMAQIKLGHALEEFKSICEEVTYAGSRVEIGGGRLRGGDGSNGAWAVDFVKTRGVVAREVVTTRSGKTYDLTKYDTQRCRQWGDAGVPDELEDVAREHPVKDATFISSLDELEKALAQGYGCMVCSSIGFQMNRDARGVCSMGPRWDHCMKFDGYHNDTDGRKYYHITNSWGADAHRGPTGWGNPNTAGFWVAAASADRMIKTGRCTFAFSGVKGFPARSPDWFVHNHKARTERVASLSQRKIPCVESLFSLCP